MSLLLVGFIVYVVGLEPTVAVSIYRTFHPVDSGQ
jgi:hypothetical protein